MRRKKVTQGRFGHGNGGRIGMACIYTSLPPEPELELLLGDPKPILIAAVMFDSD